MKKILFATFAVVALFSSCDTDEPKIDVSFEKALMDNKWEVVKIEQNPNVNNPGNIWMDVTASADPCIIDNLLIFTSKSTAILDEYYRKCTESDPQTRDLGYVIENEQVIKIFTNRDDINGSIWRSGEFKWVDSIKRFTIDERITHPSTPDITVSTIYTYQNTKK